MVVGSALILQLSRAGFWTLTRVPSLLALPGRSNNTVNCCEPKPRPKDFVVKNWWKILARISQLDAASGIRNRCGRTSKAE